MSLIISAEEAPCAPTIIALLDDVQILVTGVSVASPAGGKPVLTLWLESGGMLQTEDFDSETVIDADGFTLRFAVRARTALIAEAPLFEGGGACGY